MIPLSDSAVYCLFCPFASIDRELHCPESVIDEIDWEAAVADFAWTMTTTVVRVPGVFLRQKTEIAVAAVSNLP